MNRKILICIKIMLVFLGIVIFPLGLFLLGYIIGSRKSRKTVSFSSENEAKLIEKSVLTDSSEENSDRVIVN